jgi:hypothetical protein
MNYEAISRTLLCASLLSLLSACGGSQPSGTDEKSGVVFEPSSSGDRDGETTPAAEEVALARAASLNTSSLEAAEQRAKEAEARASSTDLNQLQPGQPAPKSAYASGDIARKALAVGITAYRFYNGATGSHFYTVSEAERDNVRNNLSPPFTYEGEAYRVASAYAPGLSPVHRFYNTRNGVHFYTISETERAHVAATLPHYNYEGVAYHASEVAGANLIPFHRFYVPSKGFHFYTASEAEKNNIIANLGATYRYEGVGYYVLDTGWRDEKLAHSGVTTCYRAGSDALQSCTDDETQRLNNWQDGHIAYRDLGQMAYGRVPVAGSTATHPLTECMVDRVTGLVWEGKSPELAHARSVARSYTHLGNGAATDVSGHLAAVNASRLCGFNDWRVPNRMELQSIVNYGATELMNPYHTGLYARGEHWSSEVDSQNANRAWFVSFMNDAGWSLTLQRDVAKPVRLVRGVPFGGGVARFSYTSITYPGDAANNVVNDNWTGLQWRRCEEGRTWTGTACAGDHPAEVQHETALYESNQKAGWRMPNIKELTSLYDLHIRNGARLDPVAFPGVDASTTYWSTTPYFKDPSSVWAATNGLVNTSFHTGSTKRVRLLRNNY